MRPVVVSEYNPRWPTFFEQIHAILWPAVQDVATAIEHVGSTAVPGLAAKPIIDIDIVIPPHQNMQHIIEHLEPLGYTHLGTLGIAGRDAFRQENTLPKHNLYVCPADSIGLRNHLAVRDYLRAHPEAVQAYGELKRRLASTFTNDIDRYVDGKTDFIISLLRQSSVSTEDIAAIEQANRIT
jgi:GrpB-like predicted nucleotidyltransferase (UPF0157 family)